MAFVGKATSVSIIIPVRNEAGHIARCLDSVLALDLDGIEHEILVVDGMSDDGTIGVVERYQARRADLKIIPNPRKGVAAARNIGIKAARGDVLVLMDAHARYAPDYVKRCLEVMENTGAANVGGPAIALPGGAGAMAGAISLAHHSSFGLGGGEFRDPDAEGFVETVWPGCYRREVFAKAGYIDERRSRTEDLEFNSRLRAAGFTIYLSPRIMAWYYCRTTLGETWRQRWADGYEITRFLPDNPAAPKLRHFVPLAFVASLILFAALAVFVPGLQQLAMVVLFAELAAYLLASVFFTIQSYLRSKVHQDESSADTGSKHSNLELSNREHGLGSIALLPIVFATLHFSYGLGSIWGLASLPYWALRKQKRELQNPE